MEQRVVEAGNRLDNSECLLFRSRPARAGAGKGTRKKRKRIVPLFVERQVFVLLRDLGKDPVPVQLRCIGEKTDDFVRVRVGELNGPMYRQLQMFEGSLKGRGSNGVSELYFVDCPSRSFPVSQAVDLLHCMVERGDKLSVFWNGSTHPIGGAKKLLQLGFGNGSGYIKQCIHSRWVQDDPGLPDNSTAPTNLLEEDVAFLRFQFESFLSADGEELSQNSEQLVNRTSMKQHVIDSLENSFTERSA